MNKQTDTNESTTIDWPQGFDRNNPGDRKSTRKFDVTLAKAFDDLEATLALLGADHYRYDFDAPTRQKDGRPYRRANPDDAGFVVRWTMDGDDYAVACDRYTKLRDNVRAVGLYLDEKRKMDSRPVKTGESEFANARLPPADEDSDAIVASEPPHVTLNVARDAPDGVVKAAARELKKQSHPDNGGDRKTFKRVVRAEERMLENGGTR